MFKTLEECFDWLYEPREFEIKYDLGRIQQALDALGNPTDYKFIHIGGTNGKGSTLSYIKNSMINAGYNVGTFISPYVVNFNERITYNNEYIKDEEIIHYMNQIRMSLEFEGIVITYFEVLTIMAFMFFSDKGVDYALMEVGLGGRLDSTNVIPHKEVAVITNVGYDHMDILGTDIVGIAKEKLGIVHDKLITSIQPELRGLFEEYTKARRADMQIVEKPAVIESKKDSTYFEHEGFKIKLSMLGEHQAHNAALAIETLKYLRDYKGLDITDLAIIKGLTKTFWPGRLENIKDNIYVDGGHNVEGITTLCNFLKNIDEKKRVIFTCLKDKPYEKMVELLDEVADELIITEFVYDRALEAEELYRVSNHQNKHLVKNYKDTFEMIDDGMTIYCGSLYFISKIRQEIFE